MQPPLGLLILQLLVSVLLIVVSVLLIVEVLTD